jgi:hypothetical protein
MQVGRLVTIDSHAYRFSSLKQLDFHDFSDLDS